MAEDLQYASRADNKRKFDDPTPPRRASGFSAVPITSPDGKGLAGPPASYNSVPPPADDIQLAKQRAQEIAARLFSAAEAKRPRVDGEAGSVDGDSGFGSDHLYNKSLGQQVTGSFAGTNPPASIPSYGYQGSSKKIDIPNDRVGVIIGKGGETIKYLQLQSGAKIQVTRDGDADPGSRTRLVELMGTSEQISKAEQLINDVLAEAEAGASGIVGARKFSGAQVGAEHFIMKVPNNKVGLVIGKGGETIKNMQARSGARIQLIPLHLPPGDTSTERTVHIDGTEEQIEMAKQLVNEVISEISSIVIATCLLVHLQLGRRMDIFQLDWGFTIDYSVNRIRNPQSGGYPQQGYRPPRPQTSWGPPGPPPPMQQGYGYMQPGAYPAPPPQYNMSQPPYSGYSTTPASGGYSSGWDQSTNPPSQQATAASGYDYYNQQGQSQQQAPPQGGSSAPTDNAGYNYGQPQPSGYNTQGSYGDTTFSQQSQGYSQDGYGGGYQATQQQGYTNQPSTTQPGYDQQQNYSSAAPYATQDGSAPGYTSQGGSAQVPPAQQGPPGQPPAVQQGYAQPAGSTPSSYSHAGQSGYGVPPTSQPGYGSQPPPAASYGQPTPLSQSAYGQPPLQQKPQTSAASYAQPPSTQSTYGSTQPPTAQSGYAGAPPSSYPPSGAQPSYGQQQPYGGAPPGQSGYGQQPQYGDSYGAGGYAQPPGYSTESGAGGSGVYDAQATGQAVSGGVTKASPKTQS